MTLSIFWCVFKDVSFVGYSWQEQFTKKVCHVSDYWVESIDSKRHHERKEVETI